KDRAVADRFYKDILGFRETWHGGMTDARTDWVDMRVPEGTDWLEYMLNVKNPSPRSLGVMHHLALGVPSVGTAYPTLLKRGLSASIFFFVSVSILISPGHGRAKPSVGHLRVASTPILEPKLGSREACSSWSTGPRVNSMSRSGSMWFRAFQATSRISWTFTSWSTTTMHFVNMAPGSPQMAFITLRAWPG